MVGRVVSEGPGEEALGEEAGEEEEGLAGPAGERGSPLHLVGVVGLVLLGLAEGVAQQGPLVGAGVVLVGEGPLRPGWRLVDWTGRRRGRDSRM